MINMKVSFILLKHENQRETQQKFDQRQIWKDWSARNMKRLKLDYFHPKQTREGTIFACGYTWASKQRHGNKKKITLRAELFFFHQFFRSIKRLSTNWPYMWAF